MTEQIHFILTIDRIVLLNKFNSNPTKPTQITITRLNIMEQVYLSPQAKTYEVVLAMTDFNKLIVLIT